MQKLGLGALIALTIVVMSYAAAVAQSGGGPAKRAAASAPRSPQDIARRDRMAQLVAEVAAHSAAHTAKTVATDRMQALAATQQDRP